MAGPQEAIPQFIIPTREFPDKLEFEQIKGFGELAIAGSLAAATALEPFTEASQFRDQEYIEKRGAAIVHGNPFGVFFLGAAANTFNKGFDRRIRYDDTTMKTIDNVIAQIEKESGGTVWEDQRRVLSVQLFLKRCVEWSVGHTPKPSSALIIPSPRQEQEVVPGGQITLI